MISAARSKLAIPVQFIFLVVNGLGIFTSIVYDAKTPDLYPNNAHHKIGWAVTWIAVVWVLLGFVSLFNVQKNVIPASHPMTTDNMTQYQRLNNYDHNMHEERNRASRDSGQETERNSDTLCGPSRTNSETSILHKPEQASDEANGADEGQDVGEGSGLISNSRVDQFLSRKVPRVSAGRTLTALKISYVVLERIQILLGFLAITTGIVTWWGIFHQGRVFNGLAHWIKGGIFFWYGLLTLGRWIGAFSDFGWAWNVRPQYPLATKFASIMPSAEFVESFVIFFYGASNIFLEHIASWGKPWQAADFEHVSITIMFFGGGLLGMLIESKTARHFLNSNILLKQEQGAQFLGSVEAEKPEWETPKSYTTSLNPMPALVIVLLGIMMGAHHQTHMVSTMLHAQWGKLFVGFGLSRAITYIMLYLSPPTSHFPSRPPSEVIAAFCLCSGGLIFMASTNDVVTMLEVLHLDAMFIFTVVMGMTALIMAWATILYCIKGWAMRREARKSLQ